MQYSADVLELAREVRRQRAAEDLEWFARYYLGEYFPQESPKFARELDELYLSETNSLTQIPIGHGKSTRQTFLHPTHAICMDPNVRVIIASKTHERAAEFVRRIGNELRFNKRLIRDFGPFYNKNNVWSSAKFTVIRRLNRREPTVTAVGLGGTVEGLRVDKIFGDDMIDVVHQTSEVEREGAKSWFDNTLHGRLDPKGTIHVIGTPWHPNDLYAHIEKKASFAVRRYPAILDEVKKLVLWPGRWSYETLMERKLDMGTIAFRQKYMCDPQAIVGHWFQPSWMTYADTVPRLKRVVQGWDFNVSEKSMSDYTVGITLGVDEYGDFYILDMMREHMLRGHEQAIINMFTRWAGKAPVPERVGVEANVFQQKIYEGVTARAPHIPVVPVKVTTDKGTRVMAWQPFFEAKRVKILNSLPDKDEFVNEMLTFPDGVHDDMLDALGVCFRLLGVESMGVLETEELDEVF